MSDTEADLRHRLARLAQRRAVKPAQGGTLRHPTIRKGAVTSVYPLEVDGFPAVRAVTSPIEGHPAWMLVDQGRRLVLSPDDHKSRTYLQKTLPVHAGPIRKIAILPDDGSGSATQAARALSRITLWTQHGGVHQFVQFLVGISYNTSSNSFVWEAAGYYSTSPLQSITIRYGSTYDRTEILATWSNISAEQIWNVMVESLQPFTPGFEAAWESASGTTPSGFTDMTKPCPAHLGSWRDVTYLNGWSRYSTSWIEPGYMIDSNGRVHLRGMIAGGTIGSPMFSIPSRFGPKNNHLFSVRHNDNSVNGRVDVRTNGDVVAISPTVNSWVSLDGISYTAGE